VYTAYLVTRVYAIREGRQFPSRDFLISIIVAGLALSLTPFVLATEGMWMALIWGLSAFGILAVELCNFSTLLLRAHSKP
jgi:hypothetical protein